MKSCKDETKGRISLSVDRSNKLIKNREGGRKEVLCLIWRLHFLRLVKMVFLLVCTIWYGFCLGQINTDCVMGDEKIT